MFYCHRSLGDPAISLLDIILISSLGKNYHPACPYLGLFEYIRPVILLPIAEEVKGLFDLEYNVKESVFLPWFPGPCPISSCLNQDPVWGLLLPSHLLSQPYVLYLSAPTWRQNLFSAAWHRSWHYQTSSRCCEADIVNYHTLYRYFVAWHRCYWAADSGNLLMEFMVPTANVGTQQELLPCAGAVYCGRYSSPCWLHWASFGAAASFNLRWALSLACQGCGWLNCREQHHIDMQSQGRERILHLVMSLCFSSFSPASPCTHSVCAFQLLWE